MNFVFKYYAEGEEVRPTATTLRLLTQGLHQVIAVDCLNDIIHEAEKLRDSMLKEVK